MISFFPDVNVWLALSLDAHPHYPEAWRWLNAIPADGRLLLCWYTQLALLRLLTNRSVVEPEPLTIAEAWEVLDRFLLDPRIEFHPEPPRLDPAFRQTTAPLEDRPASKWIGDCFLLAYAEAAGATLVTFDKALLAYSLKHGYAATCPE